MPDCETRMRRTGLGRYTRGVTETTTALEALPLREDLRGRSPYGAPMIDVPVTLNVNENTHPMPQEVIDAITRDVAEAAVTLNRYPDREFDTLRAELANYLGHGLTPENIWAANQRDSPATHAGLWWPRALGHELRTHLLYVPLAGRRHQYRFYRGYPRSRLLSHRGFSS